LRDILDVLANPPELPRTPGTLARVTIIAEQTMKARHEVKALKDDRR
jgi:hypothetical protein